MADEHFLVVGGTSGSGRALVRRLSERAEQISVIGRRLSPEAQRKLPGLHFYPTELSDPASIGSTIQSCLARVGKLNHLVFFQRYRGKSDPWVGEFQVSLTATKLIIELCSEHFPAGGNNAVVIVGSNANRLVYSEQPVSYHMAKAALDQMVRYYAVTLGPKGVRVNSVSPETVLKEESRKFYEENPGLREMYETITPLGRMGTSEDVANAIDFLCTPQASFITGQNLVVDGGLSLVAQATVARRAFQIDGLKLNR